MSNESPVRKMYKVNTPTQSVHKQLFPQDPLAENPGYMFKNHTLSAKSERMECLVGSVNTLTSTHTCISDEVNTTVDRDCTIDCKLGLNDKASIEKAISHMQRLLPSVTSHIAEQGRLSE